MAKIIIETKHVKIYESENGRRTPLMEMSNQHLVNAYGKICYQGGLQAQEGVDDVHSRTKEMLKDEMLRRLATANYPTEE